MAYAPSDHVYFASFDEPEFGAKVLAKIEADDDTFVKQIRSKLATAYKYYYGFDLDGNHAVSAISRAGEQGELATYRVNHARALVNTLLNLVISQRIVWQPKATNIDYESLKAVEVAKSVLEYYWTERNVERLTNKAVEEAIAFSEGFVLGLWDEFAGEDVGMDPESDPENPKPLRSGDFVFQNVSTWNVRRDSRKHSWEELDWVIVTIWKNKYDLLAQYPEYAEEICSAPKELPTKKQRSPNHAAEDNDDVPVHLFFHRPTAALPYGREAWILGDKTVIRDGKLSYTSIPLVRFAPSELVGTPFGYTSFFEILAIQELVDSLHSTAASNLTTFGTQNIFLPSQSEIQSDQIGGGLRIIQGGPDGKEPKALELCKTPPELYKHLEDLVRAMETLVGVNGTVRGQVQNDKLSGAAMALLETQAKQQSSGLHGSFRSGVQQLGMFVIEESKKRCVEPRKVSLVGKDNAFLVAETEYTGESFGAIKRVLIDIGNPLSQNVFGRAEQAKELLQMGLVGNLEQYFMLLDSGRTEPITQGLTNELLLIKSENEDISNGVAAEVMLHDNHLLHGREHRTPVASPQARKNPQVLKAHVEHMHRHYEAYYGTPAMVSPVDPMTGMPLIDPMTSQPLPPSPEPMYRQRMLILMGMAPPDPMMGGMPMGGAGGAPGGMSGGAPPSPPPQDPGQNTPAAKGAEFGGAEGAKPSQAASLPTDPSTGEKWSPGQPQ